MRYYSFRQYTWAKCALVVFLVGIISCEVIFLLPQPPLHLKLYFLVLSHNPVAMPLLPQDVVGIVSLVEISVDLKTE